MASRLEKTGDKEMAPPIPLSCSLPGQDLIQQLTKPLKPGLFSTPLEMVLTLFQRAHHITVSVFFAFVDSHSSFHCDLNKTPSFSVEQLTENWKPYRSLPVCYMWSLTGFIPEC
ncbi:hypothetical protein MJO28_001782 [Puccinia striiformis f. sp. tritici]|uniref:Uncharacterized protein n=1 Tax=Puccinia striiformis f. sp. tritici TaxID=168172 RepID=A0ACC0EWS5_9BASI|nr:hypothetical protein MJO28_001782 [Puccinia striiformis f. sp. tritici]